MSLPKNVVLQGGTVRRQQCYVCDPSGFMKLILWGKHTDTVEENKTYLFNKVRVRVTSYERYLNTSKDDNCMVKIAEDFPESLASVEVASTIKEVTANILGVTYTS